MAAAPTPAAPEITREQLQLAYRHLARPGWPDSLDAALLVYSYATAIRGLARDLGRGYWHAGNGRPHTLPTAPVPPTPCEPFPGHGRPLGSIARPRSQLGTFPTPAQRGAHDCKRAAANDKD